MTNTFSPPEAEEHKLLKKYYFRLAWIIIILVIIFDGLNTLIMNISSGIMGGGFTKECINAGKQLLRSTPVMYAIFCYGFFIAADVVALGAGLLITKADIKSKLKTPGLSGKSFLSAAAMTFSVATIAAFLNLILIFILMAATGKLSGFSVEQTTSLRTAPKGNPLWLDVLIYVYICLLGPLLEELIFRGVLLEGLRKYGNHFGIIMSAVLFGLMHQNIAQCLPAIAIGLVWGYIAVKSDSLIPTILLHILNNTMSSVLIVIMQSVDLSDMSNISAIMKASLPFIIVSFLTFLFRIACIIGSIVIIFRYTSNAHGKLVETNKYTVTRTWKYFFTSLPWLAVIVYMLFTTVTSISHLA